MNRQSHCHRRHCDAHPQLQCHSSAPTQYMATQTDHHCACSSEKTGTNSLHQNASLPRFQGFCLARDAAFLFLSTTFFHLYLCFNHALQQFRSFLIVPASQSTARENILVNVEKVAYAVRFAPQFGQDVSSWSNKVSQYLQGILTTSRIISLMIGCEETTV